MREDVFISFIIPCYHSDSTIDYALNSIVKQFYDIDCSFEIILVAENEQDTTFKNIDLEKYGNANIRFCFSYYPGVTANRNKGLEEARGKYVYFLDSDDVLVDGDWAKALAFLKSHSNIDAIFGKTIGFNDECDVFLDKYDSCINNILELDSFYGEFGLINYSYYSYIFKRLFLMGNNIFVDNDICNLEDYLFVGLFLTKRPSLFLSRYTFNKYVKSDNSLSSNKSLDTALSGVRSFSSLFRLLEKNNFIKSLIRYKHLFVNVVMDIGIYLNECDKRTYINELKALDIKNIIKSSVHSHKRSLYLLFGLRLGWFILKIARKIKGIK